MDEQNFKVFWDETLRQIKENYEKTGKSNLYEIWFEELEYIKDTPSGIKIRFPSTFYWTQMNSYKMINEIETMISSLTGKNLKIEPLIEASKIEKNDEIISEENIKPDEKKENTKEIISKPKAEIPPHENLDNRYTFDTFVPGKNSEYAYNACLTAAKNPGKAYNPILLYGGSGLGKTHLLKAVGNYIYNEKKGKIKITYITAENFMNEYIQAVKSQKIDKFKSIYRNLDVLLLDDIQFFERECDSTQEELFHTLEALINKKSQMVFTCDKPMNEVKKIEKRITTRLSNGLNIDLLPPNLETRIAIIRKKLEESGNTLADNIIDYIAQNVQSNVRALESAIVTVTGYQEFRPDQPLDLSKVEELIKGQSSKIEDISIEKIQNIVANHYNLSVSDLKGKKRDAKIANPRHIAIYIARKIGEYSLNEIGNEFGGRDHSTIMSSIEKIGDGMKINSSLENTVQMLIKECSD